MGGCADGDDVVVSDQLGSLDGSIFQSKVIRSIPNANASDAIAATIQQLSASGSQSENYRRTSIMGTLGYMAPEVVVMMTQGRGERLGYTKAVDMWSLGITIYKLLTGKKPFDKSCMENLIEYSFKHRHGDIHNKEYAALFGPIQFPDYVSLEARDLIGRLLDQNERTRLGAKSVSEVKNHAFFRGIEWNKLEQKHVIPPAVPPPAKYESKPQWPSFSTMTKQVGSPDWSIVPHDSQQRHFEDWDYISPHTLKIEMGIAREMDVYDSNFKVRQVLGEIDQHRRSSWLFNQLA
jgi:serine/threonine protein kinase